MTYAAFILEYPEFAGTDQVMVQKFLDRALLRIDTEVWGLKADAGQGLLCAHMLALSPMGKNARTDKPATTSVYGSDYEAMQLTVSMGYRVTL